MRQHQTYIIIGYIWRTEVLDGSGSVVSDIPLDTVNDESQTMPMPGEEILPGNALSRMINILGN